MIWHIKSVWCLRQTEIQTDKRTFISLRSICTLVYIITNFYKHISTSGLRQSNMLHREYHVSVFLCQVFRRDQKQGRNGEACRASPTCFWSRLINLISKDTNMVFYLSCIIIGIKHGFPCINVCQVPREMLKTEAVGRGF